MKNVLNIEIDVLLPLPINQLFSYTIEEDKKVGTSTEKLNRRLCSSAIWQKTLDWNSVEIQ